MEKRLGNCLKTRSDNLNLIKFIAAILVIYSHSFTITLGVNKDWLNQVSNGELSFGGLAVAIFLFSSGLFVTKSLMEKRDDKRYIWGRIIRIFPLLIFVVFITAFIIGPIVTSMSLSQYFSSVQTYRYLLYSVLIPSYQLPGVFTNNPISLVNGSLWTLILECICYAGLFFAYKMNWLTQDFIKKIGILFQLLFIIIFLGKIRGLYPYFGYIRPFMLFVMGVLYYVFKDKIILRMDIGILAIIGLVISLFAGYVSAGVILFLPYIIFILSYGIFPFGKNLGKLGNYSYAMYLVAFPIQQIMYLCGAGRTPLNNTLCSIILSFVVAVILYYLIEKPVNTYYIKLMNNQ